MIIFGTRGTYLKQQSEAIDCPNCGTAASVRIGFIARYFHIFWIPFFPTSKTAISQCSHCKQALYQNEMPPVMRPALEEANKYAKRPLAHFFGLFIIALFAVFVIFSVIKNSKNKAEYAKNPLAGDVYEVRLANKEYTYYKIKNIQADTITFTPYQYTATSTYNLSKAKRKYKDSYADEEIKVLKSKITDHIQTAKIYAIERD